MGSSDSLHQSADFGQGQSNHDEMVSASVRPFNNNPSLPSTQRYGEDLMKDMLMMSIFYI